MKTTHKLTAISLVLAILALSYYLGATITGLEILKDTTSPEITITKSSIRGTYASITWETDEKATSSLIVNDKSTTYAEAKKFQARLEGLTPGKEYKYAIWACDRSGQCSQYNSAFRTLTAPSDSQQAEPTGLAVMEIEKTNTSAGTLFLILLGLAVSFILANAGVQRLEKNSLLPATTRIGLMLNKAEHAIRQNRHHEAYPLYENMRSIYTTLSPKQRGAHHKRIMNVYSELAAHTRAKEANYLVDKYLEGRISAEEKMRLRELLES